MQRIVHEEPRSICEQSTSIPEWLETFIFKLLSKKTGDRFPDAITVATLLEKEIAYAENPLQNTKPIRLDYGQIENTPWAGWLIIAAIAISIVAIASLGVWLKPPSLETNGGVDETNVAIASTPSQATYLPLNNDWLNDESFVEGEESIRKRAVKLERSYQGSDPLPILDSFDQNLRRLKRELDAFEKANPGA